MSIKKQLAGVDYRSGSRPKIVDRNTVEYIRPDGTVCIRLHLTDVVATLPNGDVVLNSGGWRTSTTKDRIGQYQRIWQDKNNWYVSHGGATHLFADGITLHPDGTVTGAGKLPDRKLLKAIREYAAAFADALPVSPPSNGDCFGCLFSEVGNESPYSYPLGGGHLLEHIRERYYVPSLLARVLREHRTGALWAAECFGQASGAFLPSFRPQVKRWLVKHLRAVLIEGRKA